jgi:hypothetical protein
MTRDRVLLLLAGLVVLVCVSTPAYGQDKKSVAEQYKTKADQLVTEVTNSPSPKDAFSLESHLEVFALGLIAAKDTEVRNALVQAAEDVRMDKELGGSQSNSGSTSLVTKASTPGILGFAVENGALMRDDDGTTVTFTGNPVGIIKALGNAGFIESYRTDDATERFLRRFSFALSFDTQRGDMPGTLTGDFNQLSSYKLHFDIYNHRDPRDPVFEKKWLHFADQAQSLADILTSLEMALQRDLVFKAWLEKAQERLAKAEPGERGDIAKHLLSDELPAIAVSADTQALLDRYEDSFTSFLLRRSVLLDQIKNGPIASFEYTNVRNVNSPDLSTFQFIGTVSPGHTNLTGNFTVTIYNRTQLGLDRVKDVQGAAQLDVPLGQIGKIGNFVLSVAGNFDHLPNDIVAPDGTIMPGTRGNIGVGQVKLTIPVKGSGVKIPISITFANRTELIMERHVRGNIGFTLDLDSIFSRINP